MAKFGLVYMGGSVPANEAEEEAMMNAWGGWFGELGSALINGGNAFTSHVKSITSNGTLSTDTGAMPITGYSIVQADSLDAAVALAKNCPLLREGSHSQISVYEVDETITA